MTTEQLEQLRSLYARSYSEPVPNRPAVPDDLVDQVANLITQVHALRKFNAAVAAIITKDSHID